ncbi:hypothetical protein SDC9_155376 [bioreactor metagenome]|uniref:Uncharacterized protein n=1 Tax=bioreactor metagenome TaxID=1076179 RepID=A0A645F3U2_9ZZZZ
MSDLEYLVISHCNNIGLAEKLKANIEKIYDFKKIFIIPTKGLSAMYANDRGVILSY